MVTATSYAATAGAPATNAPARVDVFVADAAHRKKFKQKFSVSTPSKWRGFFLLADVQIPVTSLTREGAAVALVVTLMFGVIAAGIVAREAGIAFTVACGVAAAAGATYAGWSKRTSP